MNCPRCGKQSESSSIMCGMCFGQVTQPAPQVSADAQVLAKLDTIIFELRGIHNELCRQRLQGR